MEKRIIIFRGKSVKDGTWVYGSLYLTDNNAYIILIHDEFTCAMEKISVDKDTIGQFTGLTDKNGKRIFEGDIVVHRFKRVWREEFHTSKVIWDDNYNCYYLFDEIVNHRMRADIEYDVIGNIYQDPEF